MKLKKDQYPSCIPCHLEKNDPEYKKYMEIIYLMQDTLIERNMLAKLEEVRMIFKEEIAALKKVKKFPIYDEE